MGYPVPAVAQMPQDAPQQQGGAPTLTNPEMGPILQQLLNGSPNPQGEPLTNPVVSGTPVNQQPALLQGNPVLQQTLASPTQRPGTVATPTTAPAGSQLSGAAGGQIDPYTSQQILTQLFDPGALTSYQEQQTGLRSANVNEGAQTAEQLAADQLQGENYGVQQAQRASDTGYSLQQYGLQTAGENQSYATALRGLMAQLGTSGTAASGGAALQQSDLLNTHLRNLAGLGISEQQAKTDLGYSGQETDIQQQILQGQSNLAKALYANDTSAMNTAIQQINAGISLSQVAAEEAPNLLPNLVLAGGPEAGPQGTSGGKPTTNVPSKS